MVLYVSLTGKSLPICLLQHITTNIQITRDLYPATQKTLESPLDCKEIQPVHSKGDQSWVFFERSDAKAETLILWPPDVKN